MTSRHLHPAWIVLVAVTVCALAASGIRNVFGIYIKPMEAELGWTRGALSGAAALSLFLLGAVSPWVGRMADRWSARRLIVTSLAVLGVGAIAMGLSQRLWHIYVTAGILMAAGSGGAGIGSGAPMVMRWFKARRGLAMGLLAGGMSAGQLIIIPLATAMTVALSWRTSTVCLGAALLVLVLPLAYLLLRDSPEESGLRAYGASETAAPMAEAAAPQTGRVTVIQAAGTSQFWLLVATYFVCGYTTGGLVLTHFMPHALEHNFTHLQASTALGIMGAMNMVGTISSGWLCDRLGRRGPLAVYYFLRGLSLLFLLYVWNVPSLHLWAAIFGLNFVSTVPPTTTLTANIFGYQSVGELSGWIFFAHQVGAALAAALAGWIYEWYGNYTPAFVSAAVLAFIAAGLTLAIRERSLVRAPVIAVQPATA